MNAQFSNSPHTPRPAGRSLALAAALILGVIALIIGGGLLLTRLGPQPEATTAPTHVSEHPDDVVVTGPVVEVPPLTVTPLTFSAPEEANNLYLQFILDGSGSMMARLPDGTLRRDAAREVLIAHLRAFPPQAHIGLRAFGHRMPWSGQEEASCQDIEQIAPVETGQLERMALWLRDFEAQGMTPLAEAIRLAMGDFVNEPERVNTLIMISDGEETCGGDPCPLVAELKAQGIAFTLHVVGLDVAGDARAQLQCIAEAGGGLYRDADSAAALDQALGEIGQTVVVPLITSTIEDPTGLLPVATPETVLTETSTAVLTSPPAGPCLGEIPPHPPARAGHALAYDSARGVTVLYGGRDASGGYLDDTWEWDGINWVQCNVTTRAPARSTHALAYDSARGVTVLFGGYSSSSGFLNDTWEWNGAIWTQRSTDISPQSRTQHALAYDSLRGVTVLAGGNTIDGNRDYTWEWNGETWTKRADDPFERSFYGFAYDSTRGVTVLFGGAQIDRHSMSSFLLNDTWEWNGVDWIERNPMKRPPEQISVAVYDSVRGVTVVLTNANTDIWEWDGINWIQHTPTTGPLRRSARALAYDSARGVTVLFGGSDGENLLNDTWEWNGENWVQR